jgi:4a-hydroxytetrahydrobiopterin dehydratase
MARLTDDEVGAALGGELPGWSFDGSTIRKEFSFKGFTSAVAFVERLVEPANAVRHHPDLEIHFNLVVVTLSTHDEGGVTEKDLALARTIEGLVES